MCFLSLSLLHPCVDEKRGRERERERERERDYIDDSHLGLILPWVYRWRSSIDIGCLPEGQGPSSIKPRDLACPIMLILTMTFRSVIVERVASAQQKRSLQCPLVALPKHCDNVIVKFYKLLVDLLSRDHAAPDQNANGLLWEHSHCKAVLMAPVT
jgi:hypothetical protein